MRGAGAALLRWVLWLAEIDAFAARAERELRATIAHAGDVGAGR